MRISQLIAAATCVFTFTAEPLCVHAQVARPEEGERPSTDLRPVTDEDLRALSGVSGLALSPSGESIAFTQDGEIWLLDTVKGGPPLRVAAGTDPAWSQSGEALAFYAPSEADGTIQIFAVNVGTGDVAQVTNVGGGVVPDRIAWSRDEVLAYSVAVPRDGTVRSDDVTAPQSADPERGFPLILGSDSPDGYALDGILQGVAAPPREPESTIELFVTDLATGKTDQLSAEGRGCMSPAWSPDGKTVACVSQEGFKHGAPVMGIYLVDASTGHSRQLVSGVPRTGDPRWSPDGRRLAYARYSRADISESGIRIVEQDAAGQIVDVVDVFSKPVVDFAWAADGETLLVIHTDGVTQPVQSVDVSGGRVRTVGSAQWVARGGSLTVSPSGAVAWAESRGDVPGAIQLLRPGAAGPVSIYDPNPQLRSVEIGRQEIVRWQNRRGDQREGVVILPVGFEAGRRYPLLVSAYTQGTHLNSFYSSPAPAFGNQRHAARGYVVFFPGPRVPWMYGGAAVPGHVGGPDGWDMTIDDVESGVDVLIERGIVDPNRMAIMGFSNGGAVAVGIITRTDRYAAAISVAPANLNWLEQALRQDNQSERWIPTHRFVGIDQDVLDDPLPYVEGSPVYQVENIRTPLLLAVGDRDDASFTLPTIQIYLALRRLGRNVTLLRYAGMPHGFFGPAADDLNRRIDEFLEIYLSAGPDR